MKDYSDKSLQVGWVQKEAEGRNVGRHVEIGGPGDCRGDGKMPGAGRHGRKS